MKDWEVAIAEFLPAGQKRNLVMHVIRNNLFDWYKSERQVHSRAEIGKWLANMPPNMAVSINELLEIVGPTDSMEVLNLLIDNLI